MKKTVLASALISLWVSGCSAPAPQKTSLEIQAIQAQNFDVSKKVAFNAVMPVLQDLGFIVQLNQVNMDKTLLKIRLC